MPISLPIALLALAPTAASAAYAFEDGSRLDHRGQPSLLAAPALEHLIVDRAGRKTRASTGLLGEAAWGFPLSDEGGEGLLGLRAGVGLDGGETRLAPFALYRGYFGDDAWKTYFDIGAFVRVEPVWGGGVRMGFGVQHDPSEHVGLFAGAGGGLAFGDGLQASIDLLAGVQLRFGPPG